MVDGAEHYTMAEAKAMLATLMQRAATDPAFRRLCLTDGRAAVKEGMGIEFPDEVAVVFVERASDGPGLVLPALQQEGAGQPPAAAKPPAKGLNIRSQASNP